ncbi:MAG TPA: FAD-binding oxidoreductase [Gemmatimonadaceae bacterium]|nr:FAD-binding oxidoreductase [Gemmatimonadaceae bacterium]
MGTSLGTSTTIGGALGPSVGSELVEQLRARLRGRLLTPDSPGYDEARTIWNAMIDRRPGLIARCAGAADVVETVRFAAAHGIPLAVRGGGHNIAGNAICDGGLVVDLSAMRSVRVDPARRTARVEPGATLGEVDRETQAFGLATPLGINSTTGIAGLTLGGGYGWLSRSFGLTVDNLRSADVVTADGTLVTASETEHPDLFWALRGGGGNFGIVTSFEFALHPVGPEVLAGLIVHPFDDAAGLLRRYRDVVLDAPDPLTAWVVLRQAPPLPFLPEAVHGREVVVIAVCYAGSPADGERALQPLRAIGTPHADVVGPAPYAAFQTAFDPLLTPGARNYWKTHNFANLHDPLIDALVEQARHLPGPMCEIFLANLGGAVSRRPEESTAYAGRAARFVLNVHARWSDATMDDRYVGWARGVYAAAAPFASAGAYVNFMTQDEQDRVRAAYGANYDRLLAVKQRYDPANLFRLNQNIRPA